MIIQVLFFKFHDFSMHGTFFCDFPSFLCFPELMEPLPQTVYSGFHCLYIKLNGDFVLPYIMHIYIWFNWVLLLSTSDLYNSD